VLDSNVHFLFVVSFEMSPATVSPNFVLIEFL
jgi:hypothetical protein